MRARRKLARTWLIKGIDENLWVSGQGIFDPDGAGPKVQYFRDFVMQVPEPSGVMVMAAGMLAEQMRRGRRAR